MKQQLKAIKFTFNSRRFLLAILFSFSLATLLWMIFLPSGFISYMRTAACLGAAVLLFIINYFFLLPFIAKAKFTLLISIILIILALITGAYLLRPIINSPSLVFPFQSQRILAIKSEKGDIAFRPVECDLVTLYSKNFSKNSTLERVNSGLMILHNGGSSITWQGWPGSNCTLTFIKSDQPSIVSIQWEGHTSSINLVGKAGEEQKIVISFTIPAITFAIVFLILFSCSSYFVVLLYSILFMMENRASSASSRSMYQTNTLLAWPNRLLTGLLLFLAGLLVIQYLFTNSPIFTSPGVDSSVFQTIGKGIIEGQVPYRDLWDHKGPLIYFLNALAAIIPPNVQWGAWVVSGLFLIATCFILFSFLKKYLGLLPASVALCLFVYLFPNTIQSNNLTEGYTLFFTILGLNFFLMAIESQKKQKLIWFGIMGACSFLLRPNLISFLLAGGIFWLIWSLSQKENPLEGFFFMSLGFLGTLLPFAVYFVVNHALKDLIDQMFVYNFIYAGMSNQSDNLLIDFFKTFPATISIFIMAGVSIIGVLPFLQNKFLNTRIRTFAYLLSLTLVIEYLLSHLSLYTFPHYFAGLLLMDVCLVGLVIYVIEQVIFHWRPEIRAFIWARKNLKIFLNLCAVSLIALIICNTFIHPPTSTSEEPLIDQFHDLIYSRPTLIMWGDYASWNLMTDLPAGTKYFYQYPLFSPKYCTNVMGIEFLANIKKNTPTIIDTSPIFGWTIPLNPEKRVPYLIAQQIDPNNNCLVPFFNYFDSHYHFVETLPDHYDIYLPNLTN